MPRANCAPLLRVPWPVLEQLLGTDAAAKLSLFQSCRQLRDLVLASCSQVQLTLDTQHCALGPAAPHSLQLLARTPRDTTIKLVLKASVQEEDVCMADGAEAAANTTWLTQVCQHISRTGGLWRHRVTYLELQGAFMCEMVPACIINTFPSLQHLIRPGLFITQPSAQFTPTPCPQLRTLTINTAQLPVTNITTQQMQAQVQALHNLQELRMCMNGPPLPFTPEAITQCRVLQRPSSCSDSDEDRNDDGCDEVELDDTISQVDGMHLSPQHTSAHTNGRIAGSYEGMTHASQGAATGDRSHVYDRFSPFSGFGSVGVGMAEGLGSANDNSAHVGVDVFEVWNHILADGSTYDGSYHLGSDLESMDAWDDRDFSNNCTTESVEEVPLGVGYAHRGGYDTPWLEGMRFWGSSIKVLRRQLSTLRLQDLTLLAHICSKPQWPCLRQLDLSQAGHMQDLYVRLLLDNVPGLTNLQVSAFSIAQDYSSKKCSWQHLTVHRYMTIQDLAWLPLKGLQTLHTGPLYVSVPYTQNARFTQASTNLSSSINIHSHACASITWPAESFAHLDYWFDPHDAMLVLQRFEHHHIRMRAQLLYDKTLSAWFDELPHLHTLTIVARPGGDGDNPPELLEQLTELCDHATRPVLVQVHHELCKEFEAGWHAEVVATMKEHGHQHVTINIL